MQITQSEAHPGGRFWVAWAARDLFLVVAAGAFFVGTSSWRSQQTERAPAVVPENAGTANSPSNGRQTPSDADHQMETRIRAAISRDRSFSAEDDDIQIIVRGGIVTLTGVIHSEDEKSDTSFKAAQIAGASNIRNQLTVRSQEP